MYATVVHVWVWVTRETDVHPFLLGSLRLHCRFRKTSFSLKKSILLDTQFCGIISLCHSVVA